MSPRRGRTRVGFRVGTSGWISLGKTGPRVGGRVGPVRISTGRSGTRIGAGRNGVFASTWVPAKRRPRATSSRPAPLPPLQHDQRSPSVIGPVTVMVIMLLIFGAMLVHL